MTKETIPQSIIDKINKEYPEVKGLEWQDCHKKQREAAIWCYGLDKWISVKDGLPEEHEDVFGYNSEDEGYGICHYSHEDNMWRGSHIHDGFERINITHYQYLPKPPKDI